MIVPLVTGFMDADPGFAGPLASRLAKIAAEIQWKSTE